MTRTPLRVAVLVGSVRRPRWGRTLAEWFVDLAGENPSLELDLIDLADVNLPLQDLRPGGGSEEGPSAIADRLNLADGFVVITPEYNHSFPAALKNAIDWHYHEWMFKPVMVVSYGAGSGGIRATEQLRQVFAELHTVTTRRCVVIGAPWEKLTTDGGFLADTGLVTATNGAIRELIWWAHALRVARVRTPFEP